jgi:2-dehydro-3-deoxygalactonokinase
MVPKIMNGADAVCVVDWGSSRGRASFIANGEIFESVEWEEGILHGTQVDKRTYLESQLAEKLDKNDVSTVLGFGMVGSRSGITETPYLPCPVSLEEWIAGATLAGQIGHSDFFIFPGVSTSQSPENLSGVMRGEEAEVFSVTGLSDWSVAVLPGTHSKWVWLEEGKIENFETYPTGEVFQQWKTSGSLSPLMNPQDEFSNYGFGWGMELAEKSHDPMAALFSLRSSCLLGEIAPEDLLGAVSGLLIRLEVRSGLASSGRHQSFALVASGVHAGLYSQAFAAEGISLSSFVPNHVALAENWQNLGPLRSRH